MKTLSPLALIPIYLSIIISLGLNEAYLYRYNQLNLCHSLTTQLSINQLSLRRHEKDYFFRKQQKYLSQWRQRLSQLKQNFSSVSQCFNEGTQSADLIAEGEQRLNGYQTNFMVLVSELDKEDKQSLSMLNNLMSQQEVLEKTTKIEDTNIYAQTLAIRQHLFEYITSEQAISLELLSTNVYELNQWEGISSKLKIELDSYLKQISILKQFVESHQYSHEAGTMGAMRSNIHKLEEIIPALAQIIEQKIDNHHKVRWLLYLIILVSVFATLRIIRRTYIKE
ncbi:hypothetical protein [Shewanella sp. UCD-KL12]|uniref:hypothetical protein n=1 Tax=Shewanella sp. UCD-KL12 TaxID=1917163 RepID=UPI00097067FB|nr:hypothetical protein [Shewanella sp. UCD-KL12]